jgi:hypothetical protein|tara:strand:- start:1493 stop:1627 length:135 start_codon:yes stop_codon:yes gene_type:complete
LEAKYFGNIKNPAYEKTALKILEMPEGRVGRAKNNLFPQGKCAF